MSIWYRTGTVTVTQNSKAVVGVDTTFKTSIYPGDLFTIDENVFYEVDTVTDNLNFTLQKVYAGTTGAGKSYVIVPLSPKRQLTAELASRVNDLIERYRGAIEAWTEGGWEVNANGDMQVAGEVDRGLVPRTNLMGSLGTATKKWKGVFAELFTGNLTGNVTGNLTGTASKATGDADGNAIKTTYLCKTSLANIHGTPTAPTAVPQTMTDQMATTKFVNRGIASTPCYYSRSAPICSDKNNDSNPSCSAVGEYCA